MVIPKKLDKRFRINYTYYKSVKKQSYPTEGTARLLIFRVIPAKLLIK